MKKTKAELAYHVEVRKWIENGCVERTNLAWFIEGWIACLNNQITEMNSKQESHYGRKK